MTLVQTSDGSSFAFTSASFYPIPGQSWFTMEVRRKAPYRPALESRAGVLGSHSWCYPAIGDGSVGAHAKLS